MNLVIAGATLVSLLATVFALCMAGRHAWEEERLRHQHSKEKS